MNDFPPRFVTALLFALSISAHCQNADAQDHFTGEGRAVNRVIKLHSRQTQESAVARRVSDTTSRGQKVDRTAEPVANPSQIQFDHIQVPSASENKIRSLVKKPAPTVPISNLQTPPRRQVVGSQQNQPEEKMTIRNSMISTKIRSPQTVDINQPAQLKIDLSNLSDESIDNVKLIARLPEHASFVSAIPRPTRSEGQTLEFEVSRIDGEQYQQIILNVIPTTNADLLIGTQVVVENMQQVVIDVQQPELKMSVSGPEIVATGKKVKYVLTITNEGDGVASDFHLETLYPTGLKQSRTSQTIPLSTIQPGAVLEIPIEAEAFAPGKGELKFVATAKQIEQHQETSMQVSMYQPELRLSAGGPKLNFVERDGIYTIDIENTGEVEVTNVQVSLSVPDGMKVTTISRQAKVDAQRGMLSWSFDKLKANSTEQIQLKATAIKEGQQVCNILISSNETMEKEFQLATQVTTRADLTVRVKNLTGPVQVGSTAEFIVEVENQGSRLATDTNVQVVLPESLRVVKPGSNPDQAENSLTFNEPQVAPGQKVTFKFTAVGVVEGDHVVRCTLQAAGSEQKVISENSIFVYEVAEARVSESLTPVVPRR